jgi:phospholipid/cholesterol/gamma-HCH transport system substrate-binding protein
MKSDRGREIQVGVMVLFGILVLIGGLMFFKRMNLNSEMVRYAIDFPAVEGLRKGDRVQVRGIRVGQVTSFEFLQGKIRVNIEVEDWVNRHPTAEVVLVMKGLVGEVLIEIEPGGGDTVVLPGHVFAGRNAASMLALGDKVNDSLDHMAALSEELRMFVAQLRGEGLVVGPLAAAERTLLETEGMLKENRDHLREISGSLAGLTAELEAALAGGKLDSTLTVTRNALATFDEAMVSLAATTEEARGILGALSSGEGTAGRLLTDDTLYDRADSTLQSLDRLLDQIRRNPKAMFKASLF